MDSYKFHCTPNVIKGFLALLLITLLSAHSIAANYPLEIIQPQPNLTTQNRFYKAYPGLEYNVRLAVIGGEFPFRYELTNAPQGMNIDKRGEISWPNPIESGTPYQVTATVTDAESTIRSVSWTVTVTKNGFRFLDAVNGKTIEQGGTGTFENPWKRIRDWYEGNDSAAQSRKSYSGEFLYYRKGTYLIDGYIDYNNNNRFILRDGNKPHVWLAYPGETPIIDFNDAYLDYWSSTNLYLDGFEFAVNGNARGFGIVTPGTNSHVTVRRSKFHGITTGYSGGNNAFFFMTRGGQGKYWSFQDNEMFNVNNGYGILGYNGKYVLVEDNVFHAIGPHALGPKSGTQRWDIRNNVFYNNGRDSIGVQYYGTQDYLSGDIEIRFNLVKSGGGAVQINANQDRVGLPVYIYRNTIIADMVAGRVTEDNGPFHFYNNVIVNNLQEQDKIKKIYTEVPSRLVIYNNLVGSFSSSVVDPQGYLTSNYSVYIGSHGHQVGNRPMSPTSLLISTN